MANKKLDPAKGAAYNQTHYLRLRPSKRGWSVVAGGKVLQSTADGGLVCELGSVPMPGASKSLGNRLTGYFGFKATALELARIQHEANAAGDLFIPVPVTQFIGNPRDGGPTSPEALKTSYFLDFSRISNDLSSMITDVFLAHSRKVKRPIPTYGDLHRHFDFVDALWEHNKFKHIRAMSFGIGEQRFAAMANLKHVLTAAVEETPITPSMQRVLVEVIKKEAPGSAEGLVPHGVHDYPVTPGMLKKLAKHPAFADCGMKFKRVPKGDGMHVVYSWNGKWGGSRVAIPVASADLPLIVVLPEL